MLQAFHLCMHIYGYNFPGMSVTAHVSMWKFYVYLFIMYLFIYYYLFIYIFYVYSVCVSSNLAHVLGLAGIKLPSFITAHMVLCSVFVAKPVLITCQCFGFEPSLHSIKTFNLSPTPCPKVSRLGRGWGWRGRTSVRVGEFWRGHNVKNWP